jgi:hypothetical protein
MLRTMPGPQGSRPEAADAGADACRRTVTSPLDSRPAGVCGHWQATLQEPRADTTPGPGPARAAAAPAPWPSGNQVGVGLRVRRRGCGSRQNPNDFNPAVVPVFNSSEPASGYAWEPRTDWSVHRSVKELPRLSCQKGPAIGGAVRVERGARRRGRRTA